jgi:hypothetical protein
MMGKKKIALLGVILMTTLAVGVYAGMQLSNTLTAHWVVRESGNNLELWWNAGEPSGDLYRGVWYYGEIGLRNKAEATYHVIVKFKIYTDVSLTTNDVKIKAYDEGAGQWIILPLTVVTEGGRDILTGTWGPPSGFDVGPGYYKVTPFYCMFEGSAPVNMGYHFEAWVEQL